ncbi:hypothetical protein [Actinoplanes derwentensis]|uniref:Uncharacterized protein n=1 Tax=Actinoplanes derwentensis TaxID=113562 RepID=A0A1H1Z4S6_9ACTN|nr:hypothetical protein [Actinoplanes derwentensis]GID81425.1 hypothetical protein Ade03nite_03490 [Actinoplanes derwentensis]SDT28562.1 hypothetical protein SAMN04489716_3133 [Actinoplanes derwentensis]
MTEEHLDRLVRDADPYRTDLAARLGGAEQTLLEEIMSTPKLESVPVSPVSENPAPVRRAFGRRLGGAVAAAAVVTGVIGAATLLRDQGGADQRGADLAGPVGLPSADAAGYELDLKAAEKLPRLLIDDPAWKIAAVSGFAAERGTIRFTDGSREAEVGWYPAKTYDSYHQDRLRIGTPVPATVAGTKANVFAYSSDDFVAQLVPNGSAFVELRANGLPRAEFEQVLTRVVQVEPDRFLAAMPAEVITSSRVRAAAAEILSDVPIPPGFDIDKIDAAGANDPYQFGAVVTGQVTCTWIAEWIRADSAGDDDSAKVAAAALRSSHQWKILKNMKDKGGWSEVLWEIADKVADGTVPEQYKSGIGCP